MKFIFLPFWRLYVWFVWFPLGILLTAITAIGCIVGTTTGIRNINFLSWGPRWWSRAMLALAFIRVKRTGFENFQPKQSYVITSNHQSAFDIWALYGYLPVTFSFIMKMELRKLPLVGKACEKLGHIYIDRSNPIKATESLRSAEKVLQGGHSVVIFPEGTRSKTGKVGAFKRGGFAVSTDLNLPVMPVSISGSFERMAMNGKSVNPGTITLTFHPSIMPAGKTEQDMKDLAKRTRDIVISGLPQDKQ